MARSRRSSSASRLLTALALGAAAAGALPATASADCGNAGQAPSGESVGQARATVLCLVNAQRAAHGLGPLRESGPLAAAAARHSQDMVARKYFGHDGPDGNPISRMVSAGFTRNPKAPWKVGENLSWGTGFMASPDNVVTRWMGSSLHRGHILNPGFREAGVGVSAGVPFSQPLPGATYTLDLGAR